MEDQLQRLSILNDEEEGIDFSDLDPGEDEINDYNLCLVGTFVTDKNINFMVMKHRMASLWRPSRGVAITDLGQRFVLFRFVHEIDLQWVRDNGSWTFDNHLLLLHEIQKGEDPMAVAFHHADFWVQVHDLPPGFFSEVVGKALGNFIGTFLSYDEKNTFTRERPYMRIRVKLDIRQPLKRCKKVKKPGSVWLTCSFKYEKLPTFCFICGLIGHIDRQCDVRFRVPENEILRNWDASLRAPNRRMSILGGERWLLDEDGGGRRPTGGGMVVSFNSKFVTAIGKEYMADFVGQLHNQNLENNFGANQVARNKELNPYFVAKKSQESGIEFGDERKRGRSDEEGQNQKNDMEVDNRSSERKEVIPEVETRNPKNGEHAGRGVPTCLGLCVTPYFLSQLKKC